MSYNITSYSEARQAAFRSLCLANRRKARTAEARQILRDMSEALRLGQHDRADALEEKAVEVDTKIECKANALLISELLEALEGLVEGVYSLAAAGVDTTGYIGVGNSLAAIAKAKWRLAHDLQADLPSPRMGTRNDSMSQNSKDEGSARGNKVKPITITLNELEAKYLAHLLSFCANELPLEFAAEAEMAGDLEGTCGMKWGKVRRDDT